jgi:hypothetical protein
MEKYKGLETCLVSHKPVDKLSIKRISKVIFGVVVNSNEFMHRKLT